MSDLVSYVRPVSLISEEGCSLNFDVQVRIHNRGKLINALVKDLTEPLHTALNPDGARNCSRRDTADAIRGHLADLNESQLGDLLRWSFWMVGGEYGIQDASEPEYCKILCELMIAANFKPDLYAAVCNAFRNQLLT